MPEAQRSPSLILRRDQSLIGVPIEDGDGELVRYFADDEPTQAAAQEGIQRALSLAGAWSDLDWEETLEELDRIRHQTPPTPPIDEL